MTICLSIERKSDVYVRSSLGRFMEDLTEQKSEQEPKELTQNEQELKMLEG
jgi:hypothetical protein